MAHNNRELYYPRRNHTVPSERPASTGVYMSQWESKFHELVVSTVRGDNSKLQTRLVFVSVENIRIETLALLSGGCWYLQGKPEAIDGFSK